MLDNKIVYTYVMINGDLFAIDTIELNEFIETRGELVNDTNGAVAYCLDPDTDVLTIAETGEPVDQEVTA